MTPEKTKKLLKYITDLKKCPDSVLIRFVLYISFAILGFVLLEKAIYHGWLETFLNNLEQTTETKPTSNNSWFEIFLKSMASPTATKLTDNDIFQSAIAVFILTFLLVTYNWLLKNRDTTQQLKNADKQQAETMFSNALAMLFREGDNADSVLARSVGLKELIRLKHDEAIDADRIDLITSSKLNFVDANLQYANLQNVIIPYANLQNAKLVKANLQNAELHEANLQNAELQGANFSFASLQDANLKDANLLGASLQNAKLSGANCQNAILPNTELENAQLEYTNLQNAILLFASLQNANLPCAKLQNAKLVKANLQNALLSFANLQKATLQNADLQEANLQSADFQKANLQNANLQNADLQKADFKRVENIETADLANAIYDDETNFPDRFSPDKAGMRHINSLTEEQKKKYRYLWQDSQPMP